MRRRSALFAVLSLPWLLALQCLPSPPLPALIASNPAAAAIIARSGWFVLDFAAAVPQESLGRILTLCDGAVIPTHEHRLGADRVVVQPKQDLPAGAACELLLGTSGGQTAVAFQTAAAGAAFSAVYERRDPDRPLPFPDDFFLTPDASTPSGFRPDITLPDPDGTARNLLVSLRNVVEAGCDGWSPIGNISVELSAAPDLASLPLDRAASLDPLSTVALIDLTPGSPSFGQRIPFQISPRSDTFAPEPVSHNLVIFPGIPLEPLGSYGLIVSDRVLSAGEPVARSAFFAAAVADPVAGEDPEISAVRPLAQEVMDVAESLSPLPIHRSDVALAVRIRIRSTAHFSDDVLAMREDVLATPPNVQVTSVTPDADPDVAAIVRGTFDVPLWLTLSPFVMRGPDGLPAADGTAAVDFILALPAEAEISGNAPILMYQHGNPGSAQGEVPGAARSFLGEAGFAVGGFTDTLNRQFANTDEQQFAILGVVLFNGEAPDFYIQTYAEQMQFLRALQSLSDLDVLPVGAPDAVPDLDPSAIVYEGISYGSNHGQAFLAYAPDILAAGQVAGAVRLIELLEYQDRTLPVGGQPLLKEVLPAFLSGIRAPDLFMGLSLFAATYDRQDPHNHARFLYRDPLSVGGTTQKASILVVEGIDDSFTANNSTRSLAWQLGPIPQLTPPAVLVPDLPQLAGPLQGNVDATTTAALVQYAPAGAAVPPTPGCEFQFEGHFCAQTNPSSRARRVDFYQSAVAGVPRIE